MKKLNGFSLMEMMVVLLIVSIVAAASAPMVNKRLLSSTSDKSPWVWVGNNKSIAYNLNGATQTASVGITTAPKDAENARLYLDTKASGSSGVVPQIAMGLNGANVTKMAAAFNSLWISTETPRLTNSSNNSVLFGARSTSGGNGFSNTVLIGANSRITGTTSQSVAVGADLSLKGSRATAIGYNSKAEADNTIAIGGRAASVNSLVIGSQTVALGSNAVAVGATANAAAANSIAIGVGSRSTIRDTLALGTNAMAIASNAIAIGNLTVADGTNSLAIGSTRYSGGSRGGVNHIRIGYAVRGGGDDSIAIGGNSSAYYADSIAIGRSANADWWGAISIGPKSNAWWEDSVAVGNDANAYNDWSVAIGGHSNCYGGDSAIAIGSNATARYHRGIAIGESANSSSDSIAIGYRARTAYSYGHGAMAIGNSAEATTSYATAIGPYAYANDSYATAIGYDARSSGSHTITLGTSSDTVIIPGNLFVQGSAAVDDDLYYYAGSGWSGWQYQWVKLAGVTKTYDADRYVARVERESPGFRYYSDKRLKNIGKSFSAGLDAIKAINVYNFTFKKDPTRTPQVGVIAQDLQKIFPNAVVKGKDGFLKIRTEDIFYALVNAVKELDAKIESLKNNEIATLRAKVDKLEKENKALEKRLSALEKKVK